MKLKPLPLTPEELCPEEAYFKLAVYPGETFTLCAFSLRVKTWALAKFGAAEWQVILGERKMAQVAELAWFMLKEKSFFRDFDHFTDSIRKQSDELALYKAIIFSVGVAEPRLEELVSEIQEGKAKSPNPTA